MRTEGSLSEELSKKKAEYEWLLIHAFSNEAAIIFTLFVLDLTFPQAVSFVIRYGAVAIVILISIILLKRAMSRVSARA